MSEVKKKKKKGVKSPFMCHHNNSTQISGIFFSFHTSCWAKLKRRSIYGVIAAVKMSISTPKLCPERLCVLLLFTVMLDRKWRRFSSAAVSQPWLRKTWQIHLGQINVIVSSLRWKRRRVRGERMPHALVQNITRVASPRCLTLKPLNKQFDSFVKPAPGSCSFQKGIGVI